MIASHRPRSADPTSGVRSPGHRSTDRRAHSLPAENLAGYWTHDPSRLVCLVSATNAAPRRKRPGRARPAHARIPAQASSLPVRLDPRRRPRSGRFGARLLAGPDAHMGYDNTRIPQISGQPTPRRWLPPWSARAPTGRFPILARHRVQCSFEDGHRRLHEDRTRSSYCPFGSPQITSEPSPTDVQNGGSASVLSDPFPSLSVMRSIDLARCRPPTRRA
jgi:hypothetical protein